MPAPDHGELLRLRLKEESLRLSQDVGQLSPEDVQVLVQEHQAHQAQLELQNEELREVHRALERSRDQFHSLYHQAPVGYLTLDEGGRVVQVNVTFAAMVSQDPSALEGRPFLELMPEEDREVFLGRYRAFFKLPLGKRLDVHLLRRGTEPFSARLQGRTTRSTELAARGGDPEVQLLLAVTDISVQRHVELALRESEERYRTVVNGSPAAILVVKGTQCTFANPAAGRLMGRESAVDVVGTNLLDHVAGEHRRLLRDTMDAATPAGPLRADLVHLDGHRLTAEFTAIPLHLEDAPATLLMGQDITERLDAERRLQEREASYRRLSVEFRTVLDAIPDQVAHLSRDLHLLWLNQAGARAVATPSPVGNACRVLWQCGAAACQACPTTRALAAGEPQSETLTMADGSLCEIRAAPVVDAAGQVHSLVMVRRDITENRLLEEQLRQAQKMEAVGRLAGGVAHDFNNLLTAITSNISLGMMELQRTDPLYPLLQEVSEAAARAAALTRQLLAFSRKQIMAPVTINLNELLDGVRRMLTRLIGEDVQLSTALCPGPAPVVADPNQMEQVIVNLAINARDAMPDGGRLSLATSLVEVDAAACRGRPDARPGNYVLLAISDTGSGMTPEVMAHLFEPFFTTKPKDKGTGLGLATVFGIVQQHHGFIHAYSEPGQGTTFRIYLPLAGPSGAHAPDATAQPELPQGQERVLLVEDEPLVRGSTLRMLRRLGYQVLAAANAEEALVVAEREGASVDLLMTDVVMPGKNGRQLAEHLLATRPGLRVLFTSGYTEDVIVHHGVLEPGLHFLSKPFTPGDLARKLREVLDSPPGHKPTPT